MAKYYFGSAELKVKVLKAQKTAAGGKSIPSAALHRLRQLITEGKPIVTCWHFPYWSY